MATNIKAGRISGSPLNGLCERVCIEVKRVLYGCKLSATNESFILKLKNMPMAQSPFSYVGAQNSGEPTVTVLAVSECQNGKSRVDCNVRVPLYVTFTDSTGAEYTVPSEIAVRRTLLLGLPTESLTPYKIEAAAVFKSEAGEFTGTDIVSANGCYVIIVKVTVAADILVPSYGYCVYGECSDCGGICDALNGLPLFPQ